MKKLFICLFVVTVTMQLMAAHNLEDAFCSMSIPEVEIADLKQLATWQKLFTPCADFEQETQRWHDIEKLLRSCTNSTLALLWPEFAQYGHLKNKLEIESTILFTKFNRIRFNAFREKPSEWTELLMVVSTKIKEAEAERALTLQTFAQGEQTKDRLFNLLKAEKFQAPSEFAKLVLYVADSNVLSLENK